PSSHYLLSCHASFHFFFFLMLRPPPTSTLFPYTTLFRSGIPKLPNTQGSAELAAIERTIVIAIEGVEFGARGSPDLLDAERAVIDRKSTRLNSSHVEISYAVFCLKKKKKKKPIIQTR